jgi:hypothetical protein
MALTPNGYLLTGDATTPLTVDTLIGTGMWSFAPALASYYARPGASSWLGHSLSPETTYAGHLCQYVDKGAIERVDGSTFAGVALVPPLLAAQAALALGGTRSTVTYQTLTGLQSQRVAPPPGFRHGVLPVATGTFIPASAHL